MMARSLTIARHVGSAESTGRERQMAYAAWGLVGKRPGMAWEGS